MARKVKAEVTQPVQDADGNVVLEPGARFDEDDKALANLPPGHVRYVIVEEPDPQPKVEAKITSKGAQQK